MKKKITREVELNMDEVIKAVAYNVLGTTVDVYHEWQHSGDRRVGLIVRVISEKDDE